MMTFEETKDRAERLESFLEVDPQNIDLQYDLANCYSNIGEHTRALELYQNLLRLEGDKPELLNKLGASYIGLSQWAEAKKVLQKAIQLAPDIAILVFNLGYVEFSAMEYSLAKEHFQQAIQLEPNNAHFHYYLALVCHESDDEETARAEYEKTLVLAPNHVGSKLLLAFMELQSGKMDTARQQAEAMLRMHPDELEAIILRAQIYMLEMDAQKAIALLRRGQSIKPNHANLLSNLGQALLMLQRLKQAKDSFEKAILHQPELMAAHIGLAWVALLQDNFSIAEHEFRRTFEIDNNNADAHGGLAVVYAAQDNREMALQYMNSALAIDSANIPALLVKVWDSKRDDGSVSKEISKELFESNLFGPFGWTTKSLMDEVKASPTGKHAIQKMTRYYERKNRHMK